MNRKTILVIILFFIVQTLVTGACCKLSAEDFYVYENGKIYISTVKITGGKLLNSQIKEFSLTKDRQEREIIKIFSKNKSHAYKARYLVGKRKTNECTFFYEYDKQTEKLTTYVTKNDVELDSVITTEFKELEEEVNSITVTEEGVKQEIINLFKSRR